MRRDICEKNRREDESVEAYQYEGVWRPYAFLEEKSGFASLEMIQNRYLCADMSGKLEYGGIPIWSDGKHVCLNPETVMTLILGGTGSGKSRNLIVQNIILNALAGESMVIMDIKGEFSTGSLSGVVRGTLEENGYQCFFLDYRTLEADGYNFLAVPYQMYRNGKKEEAAISEWSAENVKMCAARQADILDNADKLLKAGGSLVYSTCTFSEEEDEGMIEQFLKLHTNYKLLHMQKLYPHKVRGEGHFAALLQKTDGEEGEMRPAPAAKLKEREKLYRDFERAFLNIRFENLFAAGDSLFSLPYGAPAPQLQTLRAGVKLGDFISGRFEPSHSLAMCLKQGEADFVEADEDTAKKYLSGLTFGVGGSGWKVVSYKGYPLGWCKAGAGIAKNHYPKGLRTSY